MATMQEVLDRKRYQQHRAQSTHRTQRSGKSNLKYARRPENWKEWLQAHLLRRTFFHKSKVIPVQLRPWVPSVAYALQHGEADRIIKAWRAALPKNQAEMLIEQYAK